MRSLLSSVLDSADPADPAISPMVSRDSLDIELPQRPVVLVQAALRAQRSAAMLAAAAAAAVGVVQEP
jgi:hypothetical protein